MIATSTRKPKLSLWAIGAVAVALLAALPLLSIAVIATGADAEVWRHLSTTVLPSALAKTGWLLAGVGALTLTIGVTTAWLVTSCHFPGRRYFQWLLILPLAMPTYIVAFCYLELFDYAGWAQTALREHLGYAAGDEYWFPNIRSLGGATVLLSLVLYPYVFITARASFLQQSAAALEAGRTLGSGPWSSFFKIALPLARPALAAGVALALMETLNDIGAVELLGVQTLTLSVYHTWLQRGSLAGAAQIACVMLVIVFLLLSLERAARRGRRFHALSRTHGSLPVERLSAPAQALACLACALPVLFGFALPALVLVEGAMTQNVRATLLGFLPAAANSLTLAAGAAVLVVTLGLMVAYAQRLRSGPATVAARVATIGYAIPGTVLAVGLLSPLSGFDNFVDSYSRDLFGISTGLILSGSLAALLIAYTCRFLAVAVGAIDAGFRKIPASIDDAARALGRSAGGVLTSLHLFALRPAFAAAGLLVFVDVMKELPATLLLRPFNFETLATEVYLLASLEQFAEASLPALTIVAMGLAPVLVLRNWFVPRLQLEPDNSAGRRFSAALP